MQAETGHWIIAIPFSARSCFPFAFSSSSARRKRSAQRNKSRRVMYPCLPAKSPDARRRCCQEEHTSFSIQHTHNNNHFMAICPGLPGWAGTRRNTHPPTILTIIQSLSASSIYHDPQHPPCSNYVLGNLFAQPLSMSFLVYLLVWSHPPHIPYISSPNQRLLFTAHAHTIATCFAVVSIVYHLFLVFLSTPHLELYL